jgi:hypothetical protein
MGAFDGAPALQPKTKKDVEKRQKLKGWARADLRSLNKVNCASSATGFVALANGASECIGGFNFWLQAFRLGTENANGNECILVHNFDQQVTDWNGPRLREFKQEGR